MKKFLTLLCMITCVFGLTACGSAKLTDYEQQKVDYAMQLAAQKIVPVMAGFMDDAAFESYSQYNAKDLEAVAQQEFQIYASGNGFKSGMQSFHSAAASVGAIQSLGEATAEIDGNQIVVNVEIIGEKKNATAEVVISNDLYMELQNAALNPTSSMGEMMEKAALNTVIGMGTVFVVLILISGIISMFTLISKAQAKNTKKEEIVETKTAAIPVPAPQPAAAEEIADEADDSELVAVIAAAIAASEGAATTEGFVVRSIRRANRARN